MVLPVVRAGREECEQRAQERGAGEAHSQTLARRHVTPGRVSLAGPEHARLVLAHPGFAASLPTARLHPQPPTRSPSQLLHAPQSAQSRTLRGRSRRTSCGSTWPCEPVASVTSFEDQETLGERAEDARVCDGPVALKDPGRRQAECRKRLVVRAARRSVAVNIRCEQGKPAGRPGGISCGLFQRLVARPSSRDRAACSKA